ncbi:MAG TPA: PilN domain-containing protein [Gemmatimonadaceae bacterium]
MIQVNLLPGAANHSQRGQFDVGALLTSATAGIKDKFLLAAVGTSTTVVLAVAFLHMSQTSRERTLMDREVKAMSDSAQFKLVLEAKAKAEATRDSLYQQVAIIKSIDDSRYLWPHLLEEISNSLPQYTWLTSVQQTSAPPSSAASDTGSTKPGAAKTADKQKTDAKARKARADSVLAAASRATRFRIVGHTVDIQALTLFMKTLESSPFIRNVQLTRSDMAVAEGKEVTEFQLEAESQTPPPFLIKTVTTPGRVN